MAEDVVTLEVRRYDARQDVLRDSGLVGFDDSDRN